MSYLIEFKYTDNTQEDQKEFNNLPEAIAFVYSKTDLSLWEYWGLYQLIDDDWELIADDLELLEELESEVK